jgi:cellulose synthase (UDP-forming)
MKIRSLLASTLAAAKSMIYPRDKLSVWLLDDGGTEAKRTHKDPWFALAATRRHEQLKALCKAMGVNYHARKKNDHAKAGNLNDGLRRFRSPIWSWCLTPTMRRFANSSRKP